MAKMKTHSGSKKRFKKTASGKIKRTKAYRRHHSWAKSSKSVRQARSGIYVSPSDLKHIAPLLPYN